MDTDGPAVTGLMADVAAVINRQAIAVSEDVARRLAQRGTPITTLLRAYRVGHACFADWVLKDWLSRQAAPR